MARGTVHRVGEVAYEVVGDGLPVTVYGHGLAGTADDCRPWAASVPGTGVLLELRGHGRSGGVPADGWDYGTYAEDLLNVAHETKATCAVAVSVSSGALIRVMADHPRRFDAAVIALPAALDSPRSDASVSRLTSLGDLAVVADVDALTAALLAELPADVTESRLARIWASRRAARLVDAPPPYPKENLRPPLSDAGLLSGTTTPTLVLGEMGDPLHLSSLAEELAAALPNARLELHPHGAMFWTQREEMAKRVSEHLLAYCA